MKKDVLTLEFTDIILERYAIVSQHTQTPVSTLVEEALEFAAEVMLRTLGDGTVISFIGIDRVSRNDHHVPKTTLALALSHRTIEGLARLARVRLGSMSDIAEELARHNLSYEERKLMIKKAVKRQNSGQEDSGQEEQMMRASMRRMMEEGLEHIRKKKDPLLEKLKQRLQR